MNSTPGGVPPTSSISATGSAAEAEPMPRPERTAARTMTLWDHFTAAPPNNRRRRAGCERRALATTIADQRKRRPEDWMSIGEYSLLLGIDETIAVDHADHRLLQRRRAAQPGIRRLAMERICRQQLGRTRLDRPVRHQHRARSRIEEGAPQAGDGLDAGPIAGGGVASRQHDPIGVELGLRPRILSIVSKPS